MDAEKTQESYEEMTEKDRSVEKRGDGKTKNLSFSNKKTECIHRSLVYRAVKRTIDIILSLLALILLSPLFFITAILIKAEDRGPVLYIQDRAGMYGKTFPMYKFRSMKVGADQIHEEMRKQYNCEEVSFKLKEDPRDTKIGRKIRKWNIDELPQLVNILKGDMSFVGPRPLPVYEYEEEQKTYKGVYDARYEVPQGLTCIWQISNRAEQDFSERMQMDVDYARSCSLGMDVKLFVLTVGYSITGKAAY